MRISDWSSGVCSSDLETSGSTVSAAAHLFWSVGCGRERRGGRAEAFPSGEPAMPVHRGQSSVPDDVVLRAKGEAGDIVRAILGRSEERRVGKACVSTGRYRWSPDHSQKSCIQKRCVRVGRPERITNTTKK